MNRDPEPVMHRSTVAGIGLLLALTAGPAPAAAPCDPAAPQGRQNQCAAAAFVAESKALESAYAGYRAQLGPAQKDRLKRTQLAWLVLRDASCDFESAGGAGGPAQGRVLSDCLSRLTRERAQALRAGAACKAADAGCAPR